MLLNCTKRSGRGKKRRFDELHKVTKGHTRSDIASIKLPHWRLCYASEKGAFLCLSNFELQPSYIFLSGHQQFDISERRQGNHLTILGIMENPTENCANGQSLKIVAMHHLTFLICALKLVFYKPYREKDCFLSILNCCRRETNGR